uniref:Uncharacterized protein n=1 Tax=Oryza rufipogon TaxID=4529 RepID=A0A0E0MSE6_ORYRU
MGVTSNKKEDDETRSSSYIQMEYLWTFEVEAWYGTQLKRQLMETVHGRMEHNIANQASGLGKYIYISIVISYYYMDSEMELTTIRRSCYLYSTTLQCFYIDDFTSAGVAGSSSGAHLHTFSSPAPSPVKRRPPAASSMVLTSFLEKSLPISSNLKDQDQTIFETSSKGAVEQTYAVAVVEGAEQNWRLSNTPRPSMPALPSSTSRGKVHSTDNKSSSNNNKITSLHVQGRKQKPQPEYHGKRIMKINQQ